MNQGTRGADWRRALRRAGRALSPRRDRGDSGWAFGVPVIALVAGLLFTTTATTADGTELREDRRLELTELIAERQERVSAAEGVAAPLEAEVEALTETLAGSDTPVTDEQERAESFQQPAGLTAMAGPGLTVTLDDALRVDALRTDGAEPADLLVHQEDMQAVVNALWAGGAEAMSIMGVRVISTSAVICVGPVLLLHGRPYSPPYVVRAIGDPTRLRDALRTSPGVQLFRDAADAYGLGYRETVQEEVTVPAFDQSISLRSGRVPG